MSDLIFDHYAHGKLLLTGEYFVLDGAKALATPCKFGQYFKVYHRPEEKENFFSWESINHKGEVWFKGLFSIGDEIKIDESTDAEIGNNLCQILNTAQEISGLLIEGQIEIKTKLEFPNNWGLGSSSTLISSISDWFEIDSYELLEATFGGSGYDLACAISDTPIFYQRNTNEIEVSICYIDFSFKAHVYFVHLGKKQNSREGIAHYRALDFSDKQKSIQQISELSEQMASCNEIEKFIEIVNTHESIVADQLNMAKVKDKLFPDFDGAIKSLGAWGGDFVMAVGRQKESVEPYFKEKGFETILSYDAMVY